MDPMFTMVSVSNVQFADATVDGTIPSALNSIRIVANGKFNPDFDPGTQAEDRDELTQQIWNVRPGTPTYKVVVSAAKVSLSDVATFTGATVVGNKLSIGSSFISPKPKYLKVTGFNVDGQQVVLVGYKCFVSAKWSGAVGASQEIVSLELTFMMVLDNAAPPKLLDYTVGL